jgi:hypothetical protein
MQTKLLQTKLHTAFAIAILVSAVSIAADQARAMPFGGPATPGAATANADLIVRVTSVCGVGGCAQVYTKRVHHPPAGFVKRAVPLAVPRTNAVQPANESK